MAVLDDSAERCPRCGGDIVRQGYEPRGPHRIPRYGCDDCGLSVPSGVPPA